MDLHLPASTGEFDRAVEALCSAQRVFIHGKNALPD